MVVCDSWFSAHISTQKQAWPKPGNDAPFPGANTGIVFKLVGKGGKGMVSKRWPFRRMIPEGREKVYLNIEWSLFWLTENIQSPSNPLPLPFPFLPIERNLSQYLDAIMDYPIDLPRKIKDNMPL